MQTVKHLFSLILLSQTLLGFSQETKPQVDSVPYEVWYKKLKELYIKRIDSESYKNSEKTTWAYYDMLNMDASDGIVLMKIGSLEWSKANLYKTDFGSPEEAEGEFKKVEDASGREIEENEEYWEYFTKCLMATDIYDLEFKIEEEVKQEHPEKFLTRPPRKKKESYLPKLPSLPQH